MALRTNRAGQLGLTALLAFSLSAQQFPGPDELAGEATHALTDTPNLEFTTDISWQADAGVAPGVNGSIRFQSHNGKFRIELKNDTSPRLMVMDGQSFGRIRPRRTNISKTQRQLVPDSYSC